MARYDKYDSEVSGFRAPLAANLVLTNQGFGPAGVSLDANGRVVVGGPGNTGILGLLVKNMPQQAIAGSVVLAGGVAPGAMANDTVDVMTYGEIVDIVGLVAGTVYWADAVTGALGAGVVGTGAQPAAGAGSVAGSKRVGYTVEATRLVVRMA